MSQGVPTPEFKFIIRFPVFDEMVAFMADFEQWKLHKARRAERSATDQRGKHTREYHARARLYRFEHPELTYRECMQQIKGLLVAV